MRPQDVLAQQSYPAIAVGAALQLQRQQRPQPPGKEAEAEAWRACQACRQRQGGTSATHTRTEVPASLATRRRTMQEFAGPA